MPKGKERTEAEAIKHIEPIVSYLLQGLSLARACDAAEVHRDVVYDYMKKFASVATLIRRSEAEYLITAHKTLANASKEDWRAALEVVKRRDKTTWSEQINQDITSGGEAIQVISNVPRPKEGDDELSS